LIAQELVQPIIASAAPTEPIYLLGESLGALLALALAAQLPDIDRVILANLPSTKQGALGLLAGPAGPQQPADPRPGRASSVLPPSASVQLQGGADLQRHPSAPLAEVLGGLWFGASLPSQASGLARALWVAVSERGLAGFLGDAVSELSLLWRVLPPETLAWRLQLMDEGLKYTREMGKV
jgi:pimeloyl-ACP methyl ester carboxylesterase